MDKTKTMPDIDSLLEEVATALADGDTTLAADLLPQILSSGDEVQCLMAESYLMQIEALQELEEKENESTGSEDLALLIDDSTEDKNQKDTLIKEEPNNQTINTAEESLMLIDEFVTDKSSLVTENHKLENEPTSENSQIEPEEDISLFAHDADESSGAHTEEFKETIEDSQPKEQLSGKPQHTNESTDAVLTNTEDTVQELKQENSSEYDNSIEESKHSDIDETALLEINNSRDSSEELIATDSEANISHPIDDNVANQTSEFYEADSVFLSTQKESQMALDQAKILIKKQEYDTAQLLLEKLPHGNNSELITKVKTLMLQIEFAQGTSPSSEKIEVNDRFDTLTKQQEPTYIIDAIFDDVYEIFSTHKHDFDSDSDSFQAIANEPFHDNTENSSIKQSHEVSETVYSESESVTTNIELPPIEDVQDNSSLSTHGDLEKDIDVSSDTSPSVAEIIADQVLFDDTDTSSSAEKIIVDQVIFDNTDTPPSAEEIIFDEVIFNNEDTNNLVSPTDALHDLSQQILEASFTQEIKGDTKVVKQRQGFYLGDTRVMIDFADGSELTEMPNYFKVPNSASWLVGITNSHGAVIPIFNLHQYLDLGEPQKNKPMLLILQHNERSIGVTIYDLPQRLSFSQSQQMEINTAPMNLRKYIHGAYLIEEELWFDLDSDSLCEALAQQLSK